MSPVESWQAPIPGAKEFRLRAFADAGRAQQHQPARGIPCVWAAVHTARFRLVIQAFRSRLISMVAIGLVNYIDPRRACQRIVGEGQASFGLARAPGLSRREDQRNHLRHNPAIGHSCPDFAAQVMGTAHPAWENQARRIQQDRHARLAMPPVAVMPAAAVPSAVPSVGGAAIPSTAVSEPKCD